MATSQSTNALTRAERVDLARNANGAILGLTEQLMQMVRTQRIDSDATTHRAALGMLATINTLSDDIFSLVFADERDDVPREAGEEIGRRLGLEPGSLLAFEGAAHE